MRLAHGGRDAFLRIVFPMALAGAGALIAADAHAKLAKAGGASVSFTAIGPAGMKIVGTTQDLDVADDGQNVTISVPLANLTTGISLRDRHMREKYLQVQSFPNATLRVARAALQFPAAGAEVDGEVPGVLAIHGQEHTTRVHFHAKSQGGHYEVSGVAHVNMKEYGIDVPSYLGVTVKPDVDVDVRFVAGDG